MSMPVKDPCPWCASLDLEVDRNAIGGRVAMVRFSVRCRACGAQGPALASRIAAIIVWNRVPRVPSAGPGRGDGFGGVEVGALGVGDEFSAVPSASAPAEEV